MKKMYMFFHREANLYINEIKLMTCMVRFLLLKLKSIHVIAKVSIWRHDRVAVKNIAKLLP
jgi:hypothetical protein